MRIHSVAIKNFPPFAEGCELVFPEKPKGSNKAEVHLLVGPNGSGKTRLLALLCAALGNDTELKQRRIQLEATLATVTGSHEASGRTGIWSSGAKRADWYHAEEAPAASSDDQLEPRVNLWQTIQPMVEAERPLMAHWVKTGEQRSFKEGVLTVEFPESEIDSCQALQRPASHKFLEELVSEVHGSPVKIELVIERTNSAVNTTKFLTSTDANPESLHRPYALAFQGLARLSDAKVEAMRSVALGNDSDHLTFSSLSDSDNSAICQCLANLCSRAAMDAPDNSADGKPGLWHSVKKRFESALSDVAGSPIRILLNQHPSVQLRIHWNGRVMSIDELPDGVRSILGWLGACVGKIIHAFPEHPAPLDVPLVLLIDEPEGHLHPKWQRQVLLAAQKLLPNAQIIAATHSPFLISSINEGHLHVLDVADATGAVTIEPARDCGKGDSYEDVVERVLGFSFDQRFDPETEKKLREFDELRAKVIAGEQPEAKLRALASEIAKSSTELSNEMGRELYIFDRRQSEHSPTTPEPKAKPTKKSAKKTSSRVTA